MGKNIDKEKLLKELMDWHVPEQIINIVEGVHEELEIDFDALWKEYSGGVKFDTTPSAWGFRDFLKSKNLTVPVAPVKLELPVKTEWAMKPECVQLFKDFGFDNIRHWSLDVPPADKLKKYYEPVNTADYSKIPVGTAVRIYAHGISACGFVGTRITADTGEIRLLFRVDGCQHYTVGTRDIESLEILKEAPNGQK